MSAAATPLRGNWLTICDLPAIPNSARGVALLDNIVAIDAETWVLGKTHESIPGNPLVLLTRLVESAFRTPSLLVSIDGGTSQQIT